MSPRGEDGSFRNQNRRAAVYGWEMTTTVSSERTNRNGSQCRSRNAVSSQNTSMHRFHEVLLSPLRMRGNMKCLPSDAHSLIHPAGMKFEDLDTRLHPARELSRRDWRRHRNGGGWVERSATVARTAFVGPEALVLGSAQVLDDVQITDQAIITASAVVSGHVYVGGKSRIGDLARISGSTRIVDTEIGGYAVITEGELTGKVYRPRGQSAQTAWKKAALIR
jgi:hypothetical protein